MVLFDKVAEFLLKQKAEYLFQIQTAEPAGDKRVTSILDQVIGRTENFQARLDTFINTGGRIKLTATKITPAPADHSTRPLEPSNTKVPCPSDGKVTPIKRNARKKNLYSINQPLLIVLTTTTSTSSEELRYSSPCYGYQTITLFFPLLQISLFTFLCKINSQSGQFDIHGQVDEHIILPQSILRSKGIQVDISTLMTPRELAAALDQHRMEKRFLQQLKQTTSSPKVRKYMCSQRDLEQKINRLENCIPFHTAPTPNCSKKRPKEGLAT